MRMSQHLTQRAYEKLGITVLYDKKARRLHVLEDTAAAIWQLLNFGLDPAEISCRLAQEYDCPDLKDTILDDVKDFIEQLRNNNVIDSETPKNYNAIQSDIIGILDEKKKETKLLDLMADAKIPYTVTWELTHFCNLACVHCYCPPNGENAWSISRISDTLDILKEMGTIDIQLTGGECMAHRSFDEFVRLSTQKGFILGILTNGTLIDSNRASLIADSTPRSVQISLYANNAAVHDTFTGVHGSYHRTRRGIENLRNANIKPKIACSVTKVNIHAIDDLCKWADDEGLEIGFSFKLASSWNPEKNPNEIRCNQQDMQNYLVNPRFNRLFKAIDENRNRPIWNGDKLCQAGFRSMCLSANGDVFPCNSLRVKLGNVVDANLKSIWERSEYLKKWRNISINDYPKCQTCEARRILWSMSGRSLH